MYNQESGGDAAATALPAAKVSYDFRYTSGMPAGVIDAQGRSNPKPTIETYGATLSFNTQLCWCARCDKCAFVFALLSAYCEPAAVRAVFGADLLATSEGCALF